jgi:hypothetical protein
MLRRVAQAVIVFGLLGFCGWAGLHSGQLAGRIELPVFYETTTIALPDGGRLTATGYSNRVQRYGTDGRFRAGWFVSPECGHFAIGLTADGRVAVHSASKLDRTRQIVFLFDLDGQPLGHQVSFTRLQRAGPTPSALQPADLPTPGEIRLQPVVQVERPNASLLTILLVPLSDPRVPLLTFIAGCFMWRLTIGAVRWNRPVRPFRSD